MELGWRACSLWGGGHLAAFTAMRARLECRSRTGDIGAHYWTTLMRGLDPRSDSGPHRLAELEQWVGRAGVPFRRRAFARVVCARGWKLRGDETRCRRLVAGIGAIDVRGPEALVARGLITGSRTLLPGVESLVNDRSHMPTAVELTTILRQFENAPDEAAALAGGCAWLQAQGDDIAVGIVCADGQRLVAACGWKAADVAGEIAASALAAGTAATFPSGTAACTWAPSSRDAGMSIGIASSEARRRWPWCAARRSGRGSRPSRFGTSSGTARPRSSDAVRLSQTFARRWPGQPPQCFRS